MKFFRFLIKVFKSYDYRDKVLTLLSVVVFLSMVVKMSLFPYGLFNFGESNIYTEGIVSRSGLQNINPLFVDYNEADREVSSLVFSGLMKYDPEKRAILDDMGRLSISADKKEYTFVLRDGLRWHDGQPLSATDVFFTYNDIVLSPSFPNQILRANFAGVKIQKIDDKTVKFILEKPNVFFISNLTLGILPAHILSGIDPYNILQSEFNKKPIGSGPYMVTEAYSKSADGRTSIKLQRNPYYYGVLPAIEFFRVETFVDYEHLQKGISKINSVVKISGENKNAFQTDSRFDLVPYELPQYIAVFMNMESDILKENRNVRLALQKSVDKEALIKQLADKKPVDTPLLELNQQDWVYKSSLEEAQGALKEAGFIYKEEDLEKTGTRYKGDKPLNLNLIARLYDQDSPQFEETRKVVSYLQESWERAGFEIKLELLPLAVFENRIMKREYDLLLVGQGLGYNLDTYSYWHSTQANPMGQNFSNYKSFQADSLIEDIRSVFDKEKKERELKELAEQIKEAIPAVFLYRPVYYYATDRKVTGIKLDGIVFPSDRFFNVSEWVFAK